MRPAAPGTAIIWPNCGSRAGVAGANWNWLARPNCIMPGGRGPAACALISRSGVAVANSRRCAGKRCPAGPARPIIIIARPGKIKWKYLAIRRHWPASWRAAMRVAWKARVAAWNGAINTAQSGGVERKAWRQAEAGGPGGPGKPAEQAEAGAWPKRPGGGAERRGGPGLVKAGPAAGRPGPEARLAEKAAAVARSRCGAPEAKPGQACPAAGNDAGAAGPTAGARCLAAGRRAQNDAGPAPGQARRRRGARPRRPAARTPAGPARARAGPPGGAPGPAAARRAAGPERPARPEPAAPASPARSRRPCPAQRPNARPPGGGGALAPNCASGAARPIKLKAGQSKRNARRSGERLASCQIAAAWASGMATGSGWRRQNNWRRGGGIGQLAGKAQSGSNCC